MSNNSGAEQPKLVQWTRAGWVQGGWGPFETFESLVFTPALRAQLQKLALGFLGAQDLCSRARLPWRRGAFLFGPPGCGKSAATRAIALQLSWPHVTIPAHEILDTHHLTRALFQVPTLGQVVVVLDNVDEVFKRVDPRNFFDLFDTAAERADGVFWFATSRHPEDVPKSQLVRPGRFEESLRLAHPTAEVKKKYYEAYLEPFMQAALAGAGLGSAKDEHLATLEANTELSYAHLQEMRQLIAKVVMDGAPDRLAPELQAFSQEQVIDADRWGGRAAAATEIEERVRLADPRLLASALEVTDAFKRVVEMTVSNASEALIAAAAESQK